MRAFSICYILGVLTLNFMLDDPIIFYIAMSAFPVSLYLLISRPKKKNTGAEKSQPTNKKISSVEKMQDLPFDLNDSQQIR